MKVLAGIEIQKILSELASLKETYVSKIYQPKPTLLIIKLHSSKGNQFLKIISGKAIFRTQFKHETSRKIQSFCTTLRKTLHRAKLREIKQIGIDRIVELVFETKDKKYLLILELFSKGNFILCDSSKKILACASTQKWKDRQIKKGEIYKYPPLKENVLKTKSAITSELKKAKPKRIISAISSMGIGGDYAEEICLRKKINSSEELSEKNLKKVSEAISLFLKKIKDSSGYLIKEKDTLIDATLIKLKKYSKYKTLKAESFNNAVDSYFSTSIAIEKETEKSSKSQKKLKKIEKIISLQKKEKKKSEKKAKEFESNANLLYKHMSSLNHLFYLISKSSKDKIKNIENKETNGILIKNVNQKAKTLTLKIEGKTLSLSYLKSVGENANELYKKAKKLNSKIEKINEIILKSQEKLSNLDEKTELKKPKLKKQRKKQWFEKFHWFKTSGNLLAIGGKDASQNETLIKKHADSKDLVFHTELAGSPFFILKNGKEKAKPQDEKETAIAVASFSRAWKLGFGSTDVYRIFSEQVSKSAKAKEHLGKGAFMIYGKKKFFRNTELKLAIGKSNQTPMSGPVSAIKKHSQQAIILVPGKEKKSEIAKEISFKLKINIDEIMSILPSGDSKII